jgi:spore germination cell wall hydrolase CwlJ-like protein
MKTIKVTQMIFKRYKVKDTIPLLSGFLSVISMGGLVFVAINASIASANQIAIAQATSLHADRQMEYVREHECLSLNIYHEARSDSQLGQKAVGFVTINRVMDERYPDTICDVVYQSHVDQKGNPLRNKCQFSWYCDGKHDRPLSEADYKVAQINAQEIMGDYGKIPDVTSGATMYHASYVKPYWAKSYDRTVRIDSHIFYK